MDLRLQESVVVIVLPRIVCYTDHDRGEWGLCQGEVGGIVNQEVTMEVRENANEEWLNS